MKYKYHIILAILIATVVMGACGNNNSSPLAGNETLDKDASYAFGMTIGAEILENMLIGEIIPDADEFILGMSDIMKGRSTRFNQDEAFEIINLAISSLMQGQNDIAAQAERTFLAQNALNPGINITFSGLQYEVLVEGDGPKPSINSIVQVHYEGKLVDGTIFDSSYNRQEPVEFAVDEVISGWTEALQLMSVGSVYRLFIPSDLGYGSYAWGPIPAYATLIFVVELLDIIE